VKKPLLLLSVLSVFEPFSGPTGMDCEVVEDMASSFLPLWLLRATGGERKRKRKR
jgi:hypothetical protein